MGRLIQILTLILGLCNLTNGQALPDSLRDTWVARLKNKDTLTIFVSRENCRHAGFEKFQLTKKNKTYTLTAFTLKYELTHRSQLDSIKPDTISFIKVNSYLLTDTNVIALAQIEVLGEKCGMKPRGAGGAIGVYKMTLNDKTKEFSNMCKPIKTLEDLAIPDKYYDDRDLLDK